MSERELLMIPGPSMVDPVVLRTMCKPTESHMHKEWAQRFERVLSKLKRLFMMEGEAFAIAGSGTLAQEIGIVNAIEKDDKVLNLVTGYFSGRFVEMTRRCGGIPDVLEVPWGETITADMVRKKLKEGSFKAVTAAHVETSTGVSIPLKEICEVVQESGSYFILDTVCSLGGMEVPMDDWGIDASCSCTQKCLGVPPGLALLGVSKRLIEYIENRKTPIMSFYGDLKNWLTVMRNPIKYYATPPVNLVYGLEVALDHILAEGLEKRIKRHRTLAEAFRNAMEADGLKLVAKREYAADTVTSVYYPEKIEDMAFRDNVKRCGVIIARGFGPLEGKIFRVGHMGNVNQNDILATIGAIETSLKRMGHHFKYGAGLLAAQETLASEQ